MHVGYIGLGAMGGALASRLVASHTLGVCDLNREAVARFESLGAFAAATPADLARRSDVVLLCLPRSSDVRKVIFGPQGLAEGLTAGKIVIDQTSGSPAETTEIARQLGELGVTLLDAPVAGGVPAAAAGTVTIMVAGPEEAFARARPVLESITPKVYRCGSRVGNGHAMKLVNNVMNAGYRMATLEIVAMGRKTGPSLATMTEVLNRSSGRNRITQLMLPGIIEGKPSSNFALALMLKDVDQAIALGMECGAPMPIAGIVRGLLQIGVNTLGPSAQLEDVVQLVESMAGTRLRDEATAVAGDSSGHDDDTRRGDVVQLVNHAVSCCNRLITYESVAMGCKFGLAIDDIGRVVNNGSGGSSASEQIIPLLASGARSSTLPLQGAARDLRLACQLALSCGAPMLIGNLVRDIFEGAVNELGADADIDRMAGLFEAKAGIAFAHHALRPKASS